MPNTPRKLLVDVGPRISLYKSTDKFHGRAVAFSKACAATLHTTLPVLTEAAHFLDDSGKLAMLKTVQREAVLLVDLSHTNLDRLARVIEKFSGADLADASPVIAAECLDITDIVTVDPTDFGRYRKKSGRAFVNHFLTGRAPDFYGMSITRPSAGRMGCMIAPKSGQCSKVRRACAGVQTRKEHSSRWCCQIQLESAESHVPPQFIGFDNPRHANA